MTSAPKRRLPRPLRRLRWLLALGLAGGSLYLLRGQVLPSVGQWLNVGEPLRPADYVLVLPGGADTRPFVAAALVKAGLARAVLVPKTVGSPQVDDGIAIPEFEITRRVLKLRGVPDRRVVVLPGESGSTFDDAKALSGMLRLEPQTTVAVVTNDYHTRRARWIFRQVLGDRSSNLYFVAAPTDGFDEANWWRVKDGLHTYLSEYSKFAYYMVRYGALPVWGAGICLAVLLVHVGRRRLAKVAA